MSRGVPVGALILVLGASSCGTADRARQAALPDGMATHEAETLSVRFAYPDSFLVGRFAVEELPPEAAAAGMESPFKDAVVLVRAADLGRHPLEAIPIGEVPVIWIDRPVGGGDVAARVLRSDTTYRINGMTVSRYPGYPGPYGDQAHYYLVEFSDGSFLELGAHRYDMTSPRADTTHYDRVIEAILPTLSRTEPRNGGN